MITPQNLSRVTVTLDPIDVDLLDRLGRLEGRNRSAELRSILAQMRPMIRQTVEAFEAASKARDMLTDQAKTSTVSQLETLLPEAQRVQDAYLGFLARLEGAATVAGIEFPLSDDDDAPASNTGATDDE